MDIVPATESHVRGIVRLWIEMTDYHKNLDPFFTRREDGHVNYEKHLRQLMKSEDHQILVAVDHDEVVGFSLSMIARHPPVFRSDKYGLISDLAVKYGRQRKGVGGKILERIFEWFDSRGIDRIELYVASKNAMGYSFWKKHGFKDYMHTLCLDRQTLRKKQR
jgi:ribosomal protein S18 acetylase RimI-like enzyme